MKIFYYRDASNYITVDHKNKTITKGIGLDATMIIMKNKEALRFLQNELLKNGYKEI